MSKKKTYESVKDAFGNDIKVGDKLIFCDRIFGRIGKTHLVKIIHQSRVEVMVAVMMAQRMLRYPTRGWQSPSHGLCQPSV